MIGLRTTGGLKPLDVFLRTAAGLKPVSVYMRLPDGLHQVSGAGAISSGGASGALTPDEVNGYGYSKGTVPITTDPASITVPTGGSIVWNFADVGWTATAPSSGMSAFRRSAAAGDTQTTSVTATVNGVVSNAITATVTNNYGI